MEGTIEGIIEVTGHAIDRYIQRILFGKEIPETEIVEKILDCVNDPDAIVMRYPEKSKFCFKTKNKDYKYSKLFLIVSNGVGLVLREDKVFTDMVKQAVVTVMNSRMCNEEMVFIHRGGVYNSKKSSTMRV